MSNRGAYRQRLRDKNKPEILDFCNDLGLRYVWIAGDWHLRIESSFDVFPTSKRWHHIQSEARGSYEDYDDLGRIFLEYMTGRF